MHQRPSSLGQACDVSWRDQVLSFALRRSGGEYLVEGVEQERRVRARVLEGRRVRIDNKAKKMEFTLVIKCSSR